MVKLLVLVLSLVVPYGVSGCNPMPPPTTTPPPDECVCMAGSFFTPTSDCSGFIQYTEEGNPGSGSTISCALGTAFDVGICTCAGVGTFTCPDACGSGGQVARNGNRSDVLAKAMKSYEAYKNGDYDAIDVSAVKAYMAMEGLSVEELAKTVGISQEDVQTLYTFM